MPGLKVGHTPVEPCSRAAYRANKAMWGGGRGRAGELLPPTRGAAAAAASCNELSPAHNPLASCALQTCLLAGLALLLSIAFAHGAVDTGALPSAVCPRPYVCCREQHRPLAGALLLAAKLYGALPPAPQERCVRSAGKT
jgi:hypothetical protein